MRKPWSRRAAGSGTLAGGNKVGSRDRFEGQNDCQKLTARGRLKLYHTSHTHFVAREAIVSLHRCSGLYPCLSNLS